MERLVNLLPRISFEKPRYLCPRTEIEHALNDVARILLEVNRVRVYIPKKRSAELHLRIVPQNGLNLHHFYIDTHTGRQIYIGQGLDDFRRGV